MSAFAEALTEPPMSGKDYIAPLLVSMYNEQCDHVHSRFAESFSKYRQVVVEWMIDVAEYFSLDPTTTHAAVFYLDRLQPTEKYTRYEWQMMAIVCLLISAKYNEREEDIPTLRRLEEITQQRIPNDVVLSYELWALKRLSWKLNARTPISFLSAYMELGVLRAADIQLKSRSKGGESSPFSSSRGASPALSPSLYSRTASREAIKNELHAKILELSRLCVIESAFKAVQASAVAAAILYVARRECGIVPVWHEDLSVLTFHDPAQSRSTTRALALLEDLLEAERRAQQERDAQEQDKENSFESESPSTAEEEEEEDEEMQKLLSDLAESVIATPSKEKERERETALALCTPEVQVVSNKEPLVSPVAIAELLSLFAVVLIDMESLHGCAEGKVE